jgi:antibiotic biosynthesis monooxygenase (ABM) superfamily enzyme
MYARVTTARLKDVATSPETTRLFEEQIGPLFKKVQGFRGAYTLVNADSREGITIVLYENKEASDAYARSAERDQLLSLVSDLIEGQMSMKEYEVTFHTTA